MSGVNLSPGSDGNVLGISTFGIGAVNSATGQIRLPETLQFGANVNVFNSDDYSLVINALQTVGDVRITSAPKILVEDNTVGNISLVNQEPFKTTAQGVSTTETSFGGYIDAGTILTVQPHISQDNWLRLQYDVVLSSFGTRTVPDLPSPQIRSETRGTVRIPDDHMVILGGLIASREEETVSSVPFLSDIPVVGELFKSTTKSTVNETLFIFIRPVILRDLSFRDLLYLSEADKVRARLPRDDEPTNPLKTFIPSFNARKAGA